MRRTTAAVACMAAAVAGLGVSSTAGAAALAPVGKWQVDYGTSMCSMAHDFGEGDKRITLGIRPTPTHGQTELVVLRPGRAPAITGDAMVTIDGRRFAGQYERVSLPDKDGGGTVMTVLVAQDLMPAMATAGSIAIAPRDAASVSVTLPPLTAAVRALAACEADLLKSWNIDLAGADVAVVPPVPAGVGNPAQWFTSDDYPRGAVSAQVSGRVMVRLAIGPDGRAADCRVLNGSGTPALDRRTCEVALRRATYTPALDKNGKPVATWTVVTVAWKMP